MRNNGFYEKTEVIHEVAEFKRSEICYNLIVDLLTKETANKGQKKVLDIGCIEGSLPFENEYFSAR